ncbi:MAG: ATP synthase subunit I [Gammaproteobacteria bacterium]|jgi:ATP synthase protein I|nr:ATP synthase subunit I [Gammaproteobacteria bacterium]
MQKTMQKDQLDLSTQHRQSKRQAMIYIRSQLILTIAISTILLFLDVVMAYSALTGGLIATIASAWFAYKVFRVSPDSAAQAMLASAYVGEIYKIILTGALFICAFVLIKPVSAAALLITYFVIHMTPAMVSALANSAGHRD